MQSDHLPMRNPSTSSLRSAKLPLPSIAPRKLSVGGLLTLSCVGNTDTSRIT